MILYSFYIFYKGCFIINNKQTSIMLVIYHFYETDMIWKDKGFCYPIAATKIGLLDQKNLSKLKLYLLDIIQN